MSRKGKDENKHNMREKKKKKARNDVKKIQFLLILSN